MSKAKLIKDNEPFGKYESYKPYQTLTPNEMFGKDPKRLLWLHLNCKAFTFSDGIRKKLNKFKKDNPTIVNELKIK
jgi:hypothetical protein